MKPKPLDLDKEFEIIINEKWIEDTNNNKYCLKDFFPTLSSILWFKNQIKQRIKSACEFYLRYKDKPELLIKEHPEYKKHEIQIFKNHPTYADEIRKIGEIIEETKLREVLMEVDTFYTEKYNDWLFKLAFKDVLEEK